MASDVWKCECGNYNLDCFQSCPKCNEVKNASKGLFDDLFKQFGFNK